MISLLTKVNGAIFFMIPFTSLNEYKIKYFQYRFINRILGTHYYLFRRNMNDNPLCTFCKNNNETIEHLFWECEVTSNFLLDIEQTFFGEQFRLFKQDLFFGYKLLIKHPYNVSNLALKVLYF